MFYWRTAGIVLLLLLLASIAAMVTIDHWPLFAELHGGVGWLVAPVVAFFGLTAFALGIAALRKQDSLEADEFWIAWAPAGVFVAFLLWVVLMVL